MAHDVVTTGLPSQTGTTLNGASSEADSTASSIDPYILTAYGPLAINVATQKAHQIFNVIDPIMTEDVVACRRIRLQLNEVAGPSRRPQPCILACSGDLPATCCAKSYYHRDNTHAMPALSNEQNPPQFQLLSPKVKTKEPYVGLVLPHSGVTYAHAGADCSNISGAANAASASMRCVRR